MNLHVVMRTCDRHSLQSTRIVNKKECILRCLNSILSNLSHVPNKSLHIIDDNSSEGLREALRSFEEFPFVTVDYLPERDQSDLTDKKKTRYSVKVAYDHIYNLPDDDLVYIVEDDYLHFPGAISEMIETWKFLNDNVPFDVGIFPQDFNQLHFHPDNPFNDTYVRPSMIVAAKHRYYMATWYTHESFMIQSKIFKKYKQHFDALQTIGDNDGNWEGNTISNVWMDKEFRMFMPLGSLVIHMSNARDIPFFISKQQVIDLWEANATFWSSEQDSLVQL